MTEVYRQIEICLDIRSGIGRLYNVYRYVASMTDGATVKQVVNLVS